MKKLYRSNTDKKIAGVCGGLSDYFQMDSTIFRLLFILLFLVYGVGVLFYILCWIIVPEEPGYGDVNSPHNGE